jgi:cytochrome c oxidase cbb3-type subunit II
VPESNMPAYSWLQKQKLDVTESAPRMNALRAVGVPYTDAEISAASKDVEGKTDEDALIAYLQVLGTALKLTR